MVYGVLNLCCSCLCDGAVITELCWISYYVMCRLATLAKVCIGLRSLTSCS
jgi:hypothetical protein